jgi:uncharacterized protein (DUF433 family)
MADLDWNQCSAVESVPGKRGGAWVFKNTRTPVSVVFDNLAAGASIMELVEWFGVTREQVDAVLRFAAESLDAPAEGGAASGESVMGDVNEMAHAHSVR